MNDTRKRYESALYQMGADALCDAIAKAIGGEQLESTLKYIERCYELNFNEEYEDDEVL